LTTDWQSEAIRIVNELPPTSQIYDLDGCCWADKLIELVDVVRQGGVQ
jgi:hypothetical protein